MSTHIAGKAIIVTGAGSGFGKLAAGKLSALGARVACADIDGESAGDTASRIVAAGGEAIGLAADVTQIGEMKRLAAATVEAFGAIDVMVNNAGTMPLAFIADHEDALAAWQRCIDINFKGVMHGSVAVHDQMIAQGRGHIVNISSIYGNRPTAGAAVYGATKAAVDYFSHALRQESRGQIKVTVVKPTGVLATGLAGTVVNPAAGVGITGQNTEAFYEDFTRLTAGEASAALTDAQDIGYAFLDPGHIADAVVHVIDQPWGVSISDITVRASGDHYLN